VDHLLSLQRIQDEEVERFWREPHSKDERLKWVEELLRDPRALLPWT
jgi:hypothetical protein